MPPYFLQPCSRASFGPPLEPCSTLHSSILPPRTRALTTLHSTLLRPYLRASFGPPLEPLRSCIRASFSSALVPLRPCILPSCGPAITLFGPAFEHRWAFNRPSRSSLPTLSPFICFSIKIITLHCQYMYRHGYQIIYMTMQLIVYMHCSLEDSCQSFH